MIENKFKGSKISTTIYCSFPKAVPFQMHFLVLKLMGTLISLIYLSIPCRKYVQNTKKKYEESKKCQKTKLSSCRCTVKWSQAAHNHNSEIHFNF